MPKKWVVNASPLIVLGRINHLFLLQRLAEEIVVPAGVAKEIAQGPGDDPARECLQADGQALAPEVEVVPPVIIAWNLGPLILGKARPRDRSEEEIVSYRLALNWIHTEYLKIPITPETCLPFTP